MKRQLSAKKAEKTCLELRHLFSALLIDHKEPITEREWQLIFHTILYGEAPTPQDISLYAEIDEVEHGA